MTREELLSLKASCPDREIYVRTKAAWDSLAKPVDGLGYFEELHCRTAAIKEDTHPDISRKRLVIMCADNGVTAEGVTQTDRSVTASVAALMGKRRSSAGIMTKGMPLDILTVDIGIDIPHTPEGVLDKKVAAGTADLLRERAMTEEQCLKALSAGIAIAEESREKGYGIIATGEMGIGNTTTSTALLCALTGLAPAEVTGRGAGLSDEGLKSKIKVIEEALAFHGLSQGSDPAYAFEALCCVGGLDIAGIAGMFIGGMLFKLPVVIDGLISAAAALCAERMVPGCREYMLPSHSGKEKGTARILELLGLKSVIDADMALGEGTGAVMLFPLLDMVFSLYENGTAFADTDITKYERFH
ncbi:MAG: nicotinate-nucleotide--dimethylbenzimidazole phosphoribosyltransferase [Lachnospiraceae bacterium]|nr:nicotinate-nucleotide--dimethylbenzimidazole phosphoribosyltransferase [Lachnospiraceae bacterium]